MKQSLAHKKVINKANEVIKMYTQLGYESKELSGGSAWVLTKENNECIIVNYYLGSTIACAAMNIESETDFIELAKYEIEQ